MSSRVDVHKIDDRLEFNLILAGTSAFYLALIVLLSILPLNWNHIRPQSTRPARKISLLVSQPKPAPRPVLPLPIPKPEKKKPPVPIRPKKAAKEPSPVPERPPEPSAEELEQKRSAALALQKARELEKNKEIANNKIASLFGNSAEDLIQNKNLNVIAAKNPAGHTGVKEIPAAPKGEDLQIPIQNLDTDSILKGLPAGKDNQSTALFGEHETKHFGSGGGTGKIESIRSPEDFERSFKAYEGRLKSFYDKTLQSKPALAGKMLVKIILAADGSVIRCDILSSTLNDRTFEEEIRRMIQEQFRFSRIAQGEESYNHSLKFHPEK
ncbi:MAG: AgmX/PglI C-terminal domain-containing protein [Nitrospirae bacterium]|nr:AgmX/PglI C-terminal domain-containing protein [Nitrospirota bacterium]